MTPEEITANIALQQAIKASATPNTELRQKLQMRMNCHMAALQGFANCNPNTKVAVSVRAELQALHLRLCDAGV